MNSAGHGSADEIYGRFYRLLTGLVAVGIIINAIVAWRADHGRFSPGYNRALNTLAFFTIQSNFMVGLSALLLSFNRFRRSTASATLWLSSLVAITMTGIVYHWLLAGLQDLRGLSLVGDLIVHSAVPILAAVAFFVFGPRGLITPRVVQLTLIFLVWWIVFTIIRGEIVNWYPYPFVDVNDKGYPRVILNGIGMSLLYLAFGYGYMYLDRWLTDESRLPTAMPDERT
jgi:hypothetical protein